MAHRSLARLGALLALAAVSAGCFTGERPEFEDERATVSSGNDDIDAVLERLGRVDVAEFTAGFEIRTKFGSLTSTGTVTQAPGSRRSITVANASLRTRFVIEGESVRTCNLLTSECEASIVDARISNTQLPHTFYAPAFETRLRISADRRIGEPVGYDETIAGQAARCVDVTVAGGTETFCALPDGVLAMFRGADVEIDLTSYAPTADETLFGNA